MSKISKKKTKIVEIYQEGSDTVAVYRKLTVKVPANWTDEQIETALGEESQVNDELPSWEPDNETDGDVVVIHTEINKVALNDGDELDCDWSDEQ